MVQTFFVFKTELFCPVCFSSLTGTPYKPDWIFQPQLAVNHYKVTHCGFY